MPHHIFVNELTKVNLRYIGNHTFEATNGLCKVLTLGDAEAQVGWKWMRAISFKFRLETLIHILDFTVRIVVDPKHPITITSLF